MTYFLLLTSCNDERSFMRVFLQIMYLKTCTISHVTISKNGNVILQDFIRIFQNGFNFTLYYVTIVVAIKIRSQIRICRILRFLNLSDGV